PYWSFSNHDVERHVGRWSEYAVSEDAIGRMTCVMLMCFPGTIGIYQGEELGLTDTELVYEELTDPPALRFWPSVKGRDGCRTPMVWEKDSVNAGFSEGTPWLPVKAPQAAKAVDQQGRDGMLQWYKDMIGFRKATDALKGTQTRFLNLPEPVLAFQRTSGDDTLTCVFNLSKDPQTLALGAPSTLVGPRHATVGEDVLSLPGNGFALLDGAVSLKPG
ncbi:MAG: alpha-amylase family glycosyl hydrolase, partial [Pseudomonadota bacterium]